jgi:hypothetical protein
MPPCKTAGRFQFQRPPINPDYKGATETFPDEKSEVTMRDGFARVQMAERGGFEPPIPFKGYTGLANQRLQPLGHLSNQIAAKASGIYRLPVKPKGGNLPNKNPDVATSRL